MRLVRDAFGERLLQLGRQRPEVVVITADLSVPTRVAAFAKEFPERYFQAGIAEQNMMGIAAGLATTGKIVFAATFACFASRRAADQVAISVAYPRLNVKILSTLTGIYASKFNW
jgi:transketolase